MKKILVLGFGLFGGVFFGTLTSSLQGTLNADSEIIANPCEEDECEGGWGCTDNPGESTLCNMIGELKCKTYGCS